MPPKLPYLIAFLVLFSPQRLTAQDVNPCHDTFDPDVRLKCYDSLSGYESKNEVETEANVENPEQKKTAGSIGKQWRLSEESSALDGRSDVWLSVQSKNTEGNAIGSPIRATLWVRCMQNSTNFFVGFDRYTTDDQTVRYRLDENGVKKQWMETMRGGDGIGVWSGRRAIPIIKSIFGKERMVLGYNTYTGAVEFTFDVSGLRNRIDPLAKACSWSP